MLVVKAEWQGHEVASHVIFAVRKQRELDFEARPTFSVLNLGPPTFMVSFWFLLKPLCKCLY